MGFARLPLLAGLVLALAGPAEAKVPEVVVSIKPIHSLVAAIMQGVGTPSLIVDGANSPHTYNMKPSKAQTLQSADVVFWVGPGLEAFLEKPLAALSGHARIVALDDAPGLTKLPFREGGAFEPHDDDDHAPAPGEEAHDHRAEGEFDTHLWLDPANAKAMAGAIEATLSQADPDHAAVYAANSKALTGKIDALDAELEAKLAPIKDKPFIVFHDAYQYFEHRYHVRVAGSITVSPETLPGAERIAQIHDKVGALGATCVFAEPQFEPRLITVVIEGSSARAGTLDPEAATLTEGPDLYFDMMRAIADSLKTCLSR